MAGDNLDIDGIIKGLSSPTVGKNTESVMGMLKEVNAVLAEARKTISFLEATGLKPLIVRAAGAKLGIDAESPLKSENGFQAQTPEHQKIFDHLNILSVEDLQKMFNPTDKDVGKDDVQT